MRPNHMNAAAMRTAGRYLGAWGAIVGGVVLLSLLFTFLGTITCAVLIGMMMGAFKGARWFSVSVSLVFPAVIFGLVRGARVELTQGQVIVLAAVCFGIYWATYLVSAVVFFCEQKGKKRSEPCSPAAHHEALAAGGHVVACDSAPAGGTLGSLVRERELCLEQLQGNWVCEAPSAGELRCKKVIQIKEAKLELKSIDISGRITLLAAGDVTLQSSWPSRAFITPQVASEAVDFIVGL